VIPYGQTDAFGVSSIPLSDRFYQNVLRVQFVGWEYARANETCTRAQPEPYLAGLWFRGMRRAKRVLGLNFELLSEIGTWSVGDPVVPDGRADVAVICYAFAGIDGPHLYIECKRVRQRMIG
jgi:hypothetical protein